MSSKAQINLPYSITVSSAKTSNPCLTFCHKVVIVFLACLIIVAVIALSLYFTSNKAQSHFDVTPCRVKLCGQTGPDYVATRIVGGRDALKDEFPYQVTLTGADGVVFCGGSMINDRWILTAAHCLFTSIFRRTASSINVSIGIQFSSEIRANMIPLEDVWVHPNYANLFSKKNDIALLKTAKSIKLSSKNFVNPICLPFDDIETEPFTVARVSGFGATVENGPMNTRLKTGSIKIVDDFLCQNLYTGYLTYNQDSMICAGNLLGGDDTCQGDSGGPLAIKDKNGSYVLKGITSYGRGCGRINSPGVYTKVSHYLEWVCEQMVNNGLD